MFNVYLLSFLSFHFLCLNKAVAFSVILPARAQEIQSVNKVDMIRPYVVIRFLVKYKSIFIRAFILILIILDIQS